MSQATACGSHENSMQPRCLVCDWPLKATIEEGCIEGNCSYRPQEWSQEYYRIQQRRAALRNGWRP